MQILFSIRSWSFRHMSRRRSALPHQLMDHPASPLRLIPAEPEEERGAVWLGQDHGRHVPDRSPRSRQGPRAVHEDNGGLQHGQAPRNSWQHDKRSAPHSASAAAAERRLQIVPAGRNNVLRARMLQQLAKSGVAGGFPRKSETPIRAGLEIAKSSAW